MATALTCEDRSARGVIRLDFFVINNYSTVQVEQWGRSLSVYSHSLFYFTRVLHCASHSYFTTVIQSP